MNPVTSRRPSAKRVTAEEQSTVTTLLQEVGIDTTRGIQLQDGKKAPINHENNPLETVSGNYGIYAGNHLLVLDIDDYRDGEEVPQEVSKIIEECPTTTTSSPHGGIHLYYRVPDGFHNQIEEVAGKKNPTVGCVEIKAFNQYTVGPGSQLDGCTKEWCEECANPESGYYSLIDDRQIATLPTEELLSVIEEYTEEPEQSTPTVPAGEIKFNDDVEEWIQSARKTDTYLNELMEWSGSTSATPTDFNLRYEDRSQNEVALAQKLMWRFGSFNEYEQITRGVMQKLHPPKWDQSGQSYKDSVINAAKAYTVDIGEFYQPKSSGERSVMQCHAEAILLQVAFLTEDTFTTKEVSEWQAVGYHQTIRILNDLESAGYLRKGHVGSDNCWHKVSEIPTNGPVHEMFVDQYHTIEEVQQQRHEYMLEVNQ